MQCTRFVRLMHGRRADDTAVRLLGAQDRQGVDDVPHRRCPDASSHPQGICVHLTRRRFSMQVLMRRVGAHMQILGQLNGRLFDLATLIHRVVRGGPAQCTNGDRIPLHFKLVCCRRKFAHACRSTLTRPSRPAGSSSSRRLTRTWTALSERTLASVTFWYVYPSASRLHAPASNTPTCAPWLARLVGRTRSRSSHARSARRSRRRLHHRWQSSTGRNWATSSPCPPGV